MVHIKKKKNLKASHTERAHSSEAVPERGVVQLVGERRDLGQHVPSRAKTQAQPLCHLSSASAEASPAPSLQTQSQSLRIHEHL